MMKKKLIETIAEKNRIASNIIEALMERKSFLMLGHRNPDEDCFASMVAFALLVTKFEKRAQIFVGGAVNDNYEYLIQICEYNSIGIGSTCDLHNPPIDTVVVCDTAKPDMIELPPEGRALLDDPAVVVIEFDHHLETDSNYCGDADYALVTEASSSAELIGYVALKLNNRPEVLHRHNITNLFSRNLVLSVLTGIIGDTQMGKFVKSRRGQRFYGIYSSMFNELLERQTTRTTNVANKDELFSELHKLSDAEAQCYQYLVRYKTDHGRVAALVLDKPNSADLFSKFTPDTVVSVARALADMLADESGGLSLVCYYDNPSQSDLIQFRVRRSRAFKTYDVRELLETFSIENGGGHEGAIGFRVLKDRVADVGTYTQSIIRELIRATQTT